MFAMSKPISIFTTTSQDYSKIFITCDSDLLPNEIMELTTPRLDLKKGVLIDNTDKPLLMCYLTSIYRNCAWVAVLVPERGYYMIVNGKKGKIRIGQTLEVVEDDGGDDFLIWH